MRTIVLGLQQSGTSMFAGLCNEAGWKSPTPHHGSRPYPAWENKQLFELNKEILRTASENPIPGWVWHPDRSGYRVTEDHRATAIKLLDKFDDQFDKWTFKNPESSLTYHLLWHEFEWDHVVVCYCDPLMWIPDVKRDHIPGRIRILPEIDDALQRVWIEVMNNLLKIEEAIFVRFPTDADEFFHFMGGKGKPKTFKPNWVPKEHKVPDWARSTWLSLEERSIRQTV